MKRHLVALLAIISYGQTFKFQDPNQPGVEFGNATDSAQNVIVNEDNAGAISKVVTITEVEGDLYMSYESNVQQLLQPLLAKSPEGEYGLIINRLDFENLNIQNIQPYFLIDFFENDDTENKQSLNVSIKNIDDESPTLTVGPCAMNEGIYITTQVPQYACEFQVSDPDGFLSSMDFTDIVSIEGNASVFALKYKEPPSDDVKESVVYLVLNSNEMLDYGERTFYFFEIKAKDGNGHPTTMENVPVLVQVEDIPDNGPVWQVNDYNITIDEETITTLQVKAIDGDMGINNDIEYSIWGAGTLKDFITIDSNTGLITIDAIDRDVLSPNSKFSFTARAKEIQDFLQKYTDAEFEVTINDLDDNIPKISVVNSTMKELNLSIYEGSTIIDAEILVTDLDLEENAAFNLELKTTTQVDYMSALNIVPEQGQGSVVVQLSISQPHKLDFDNPDWQTIKMELHATGIQTPTNTDILPITINLIDVNDEMPVFDKSEYVIYVPEITTAGTVLTQVKATDKDLEDTVKHTILGDYFNDILHIDPLSGDVTVLKNNAFNYEIQTELYVPINATDKANHTTTTRLIIKIEDVNDENPNLISQPIQYADESETGDDYLFQIQATDKDATADLTFSIDWEKSYAKKGAQILENSSPIQCVEIVKINKTDSHSINGELRTTGSTESCNFDYELFDTLFFYLLVTDQNTEHNEGTDAKIIIIRVQDVNDNAPTFDTEELTLEVLDGLNYGSLITTLKAQDVDTTIIKYFIQPAYVDTPDWLQIRSAYTGEVTTSSRIDCDDPFIYQAVYNVTASDDVHTTLLRLKINIIDTNDNAPVLKKQTGTILEDDQNSLTARNSTVVLILPVTDADRDSPFNLVTCTFSETTTLEVLNRFEIRSNTIYTSLKNGATLDREDQPKFSFEVTCIDNPEGTISFMTNSTVEIVLTDVNDNYPTITNTLITGLSQNMTTGSLSTRLQVEDLDEGDNALVEFEKIAEIRRFLDADFQNEVDVPQDLFTVSTYNNKQEGILTLNADSLEGLYGYIQLEIILHDLGVEPLYSTVNVTLLVDV